MESKEQQRFSAAEAWRAATGQEPPVLSDEEIAEIDAKREVARRRRQEIYGDRSQAA